MLVARSTLGLGPSAFGKFWMPLDPPIRIKTSMVIHVLTCVFLTAYQPTHSLTRLRTRNALQDITRIQACAQHLNKFACV